MKKHLFLATTLATLLVHAQKNDNLLQEFEQQRIINNKKFEVYVSKNYDSSTRKEASAEIEKKRQSIAGFIGNIPYFHTENDINQIKGSNSDFLQNGTIAGLSGSFNGENIKFTVFDGGRVFAQHNIFNNLPNRVTNKEAATMNYSNHATAVSNFIGGKSYIYASKDIQGIAKNSTLDSYSFRSSVLLGNTSEIDVFQKILIAQPKLSNHSYGNNMGWDYVLVNGVYSWVWNGYYKNGTSYNAQGTYLSNDKNYDEIVYSNPSSIIVKSAGNSYGMYSTGSISKYYTNESGTLVKFKSTDPLPSKNCNLGYDCIGMGSLAKNIIVVGATDILTSSDKRYTTASNVIKSSYSSAGPRDDGGIKPDITAVGTNVSHASTDENTTGSNSYDTGSGTSYSGPIVTGIIGLWTQINKQLFNNAEFNAASAKVLTIHSASEAGNVGPDPQHGWGFINAKKGAELLVGKSNGTVIFTDEVLNSGTANKKTVTATGSEPLKVTISWIDPAYNFPNYEQWSDLQNARTSTLVNDLDLRIIDTSNNTVYYPWKLDPANPLTATKADNKVDNVEQVVIPTPIAGRTYRLEITNKGTLINDSGVATPQNYSIMVTGHSNTVITSGKQNDVSNSSKAIVIAPTKTKNVVQVMNAPQKSTFTIYDLTGKKLQNGSINSENESVDLSGYPNAIYIIEVNTGKETISKRLIKE
ncbi:putative secreted protein (Por secretion system target) [Chryseobacterium sp. 52]|uniref:S8 family peptidase n=1 Tax=Chryseobacterium sp. 52 TaxID=2035213 RepID=UPI000C17DDCA|nr:S8 family peptidase [Chryseobacterium sp. 52]PIF44970.1 putative secreted protein (Por secretion system target) [Chryseobacterium sp. 52]